MPDYISTFTTGFGEVVKKLLIRDFPDVKIIKIYDGLIYYTYNGSYDKFRRIIYLNNTFHVLSVFSGKELTFDKMVNATCQSKHGFLINRGSYRIRFSEANQFKKVDSKTGNLAEKHVNRVSALKVDRVHPLTEIWYMIRSEGIGFYCQLLYKRKTTEKKLNKGELRPEFAYLMCACAKITSDSVIYDPFCGYGAIPRQLLNGFKAKRVIASDLDKDKIALLKKSDLMNNKNLTLRVADIFKSVDITNDSVDAIITDPPWGIYEKIDDIEGFYINMLDIFKKIVNRDGTVIVLSARKQEFMQALSKCGMQCTYRIDTLVNGKKASVFCCPMRVVGDQAGF